MPRSSPSTRKEAVRSSEPSAMLFNPRATPGVVRRKDVEAAESPQENHRSRPRADPPNLAQRRDCSCARELGEPCFVECAERERLRDPAQGRDLRRAQAGRPKRRVGSGENARRARETVNFDVRLGHADRLSEFDNRTSQNCACGVQAHLLENHRINACFPERRIARRPYAAHASGEVAQPWNSSRPGIEKRRASFDAEHPAQRSERHGNLTRLAPETYVERIGCDLTNARQDGSLRSRKCSIIVSVREHDVHDVCRETPQDGDRKIEPVRRLDRDDAADQGRGGGDGRTCVA